MTNEKKKWCRQMAKVVTTIKEKYMFSQLVVDVPKDSEFFEAFCSYVNLINELGQLSETLENMVKYSEMCENV